VGATGLTHDLGRVKAGPLNPSDQSPAHASAGRRVVCRDRRGGGRGGGLPGRRRGGGRTGATQHRMASGSLLTSSGGVDGVFGVVPRNCVIISCAAGSWTISTSPPPFCAPSVGRVEGLQLGRGERVVLAGQLVDQTKAEVLVDGDVVHHRVEERLEGQRVKGRLHLRDERLDDLVLALDPADVR